MRCPTCLSSSETTWLSAEHVPMDGLCPFAGAFSAAAATIVAGAVAERMAFSVYMAVTLLMSAWTYPVVAHWLWTESGWLSAHK